jgi:DNA-directed RNA polymerase specialized sigma24 family protein
MEHSLQAMSLADVAHRCAEETRNFYLDLFSDERFCLEIFRRALVKDDNAALEALQEQFSENVVSWFRHHPGRWDALKIESEQNYVHDAFTRLWQWGHNQQARMKQLTEFNDISGLDSMAGAMRFLYKCLDTQIRDRLRQYRREQTVPIIEDIDIPVAPEDEAYVNRKELWSEIRLVLVDDREYRIIYLAYHDGLKPRQICKLCPDEFDDIKEVRHLMKSGMDRLRRHKEILRVLLGYDDPDQ